MSRRKKDFKKKGDGDYRRAEENRDLIISGIENIEELINLCNYRTWKTPIVLPVSTRAIGFSTVSTYYKAKSFDYKGKKLPGVSVWQLYRVQLAMAEAKIFHNRIRALLEDRGSWYNPQKFEMFKDVITSMALCPHQVAALLNSLSSFEYNKTDYVPLFPAPIYDGEHREIPTPEVVYLTNLRAVVAFLADPNTALSVRQNFVAKNPIPGALFDKDSVLTNPDDIMPEQYTRDNLRNDIYAARDWMEAASGLELDCVRIAVVNLNESLPGNESLLVSNDSEDLRVESRFVEDRLWSHVTGDVTQYWVRERICKLTTWFGTHFLSGELASVREYLWPAYCPRMKEASSVVSTNRSYSSTN